MMAVREEGRSVTGWVGPAWMERGWVWIDIGSGLASAISVSCSEGGCMVITLASWKGER
jgi:hypothetical protein